MAEDRAEHVATGETVAVPAGTYHDTVRVREWSPLQCGTSEKVYARNVGMIVDDTLRRR